jgi:hypothetical protein
MRAAIPGSELKRVTSRKARIEMMRRITLIGSAVAFAAITAAAVCHADTVFVPKGYDVPLVFDQTISSKTAKAGDTVQLHVMRDVAINGKTVIRHGAHVTAVITDVEHRKHFGVNAKLKLAFEPVRSTFGKHIDLQPRSAGKYTGSRTDHAAEISGGAALLLGPVGLVGGIFVVGKNITVKPGDHILCEVSHDTTIGR